MKENINWNTQNFRKAMSFYCYLKEEHKQQQRDTQTNKVYKKFSSLVKKVKSKLLFYCQKRNRERHFVYIEKKVYRESLNIFLLNL